MKSNKFYFRQNRETLDEAIKTEISFSSLVDFINYINDKFSKEICIRYYGYDNRYNIGSTYIVSCGLGVLGFLYLKDVKTF